ncbi:CASP-like protein [Acorus calamus]|uniref:CASP-like protein n=1 Tax=Acorus calamus TaxID=4465 RepID=A0AAV9D936_ACOCL|nr:CASP-like protein [Acorus calamus]
MNSSVAPQSVSGFRTIVFNSPSQPPQFTPSPFANSLASTGGDSRHTALRVSDLLLRSSAFTLSFLAALTLAAPKSHISKKQYPFEHYSEFRYFFSVVVISSMYSVIQLLKSICDIAFKGRFLKEKVSDHATFILDQLVAYLLISSSSVSVPTARKSKGTTLYTVAIVSLCMSFVAFLAVGASALLSGFKLCKRIIW